jgi:YVTN family beta-propeller protein
MYKAVTLAVLTAAAAWSGALSGTVILAQDQPPPRPGVKTPGIRIPIERLKPDAVFQVGGNPDWLAIDESVWVSNKPKDNVSRFDPKTNKVAATIELGAGKRPCSGLATGFGSLWVPNCGDKTISRIDLKTGAVSATLTTAIGNSEGSIATGAGSVWITADAKGTLVRFDPETLKVVAEIYLPSGSFGLAFGEDALWVTSSDHDSVSRVDPNTNLVAETIPVGKKPRFIAVGAGAVWALNQGERQRVAHRSENQQGGRDDRGRCSRRRGRYRSR